MVTRKNNSKNKGRGSRSRKPPLRPVLVPLEEHMIEAGMTDAELAKIVGVDRVTVTRWRGGERGVRQEKLAKIAKALGKSSSELLNPPSSVSIDAMLRGKDPDIRANAVRIVKALLGDQK